MWISGFSEVTLGSSFALIPAACFADFLAVVFFGFAGALIIAAAAFFFDILVGFNFKRKSLECLNLKAFV